MTPKDKARVARLQKLLGMPPGTAAGRLRKMVMFMLAQKCGMDTCYRCEELIETAESLSIEHKDAWQGAENPAEAFFSLDNI